FKFTARRVVKADPLYSTLLKGLKDSDVMIAVDVRDQLPTSEQSFESRELDFMLNHHSSIIAEIGRQEIAHFSGIQPISVVREEALVDRFDPSFHHRSAPPRQQLGKNRPCAVQPTCVWRGLHKRWRQIPSILQFCQTPTDGTLADLS